MTAKLKVRLTEGLGFIPPLLGYLASIEEYTYGYRHYRVRHPGGIFNSQLSDIASNLLNLAASLKDLNVPIEAEGWDNKDLLRNYTGTLFAFANYFNASYDIILGCCKQEDTRPTKEVWKWLKDHNYFAEGIYRSNLSEAFFFLDVFNELKHASTRFGSVRLTRRSDNAQILGYYLESVDDAGAIIPNPAFHKPQPDSGGTANSFNYDLRRLYYLIYKVSDVLLAALQEHFKQTYSIEFAFNAEKVVDDKLLRDLFGAIGSLPLNFLPNEKNLTVAVPRVVRRPEGRYLLFENYKIPDDSGSYEVSASLPPGDGFSRSWGLPYFRRRP